MVDIKLFSVKGQVEELPSKQVILEKELHKLLEDNMMTFFGVTFLRSEYQITNGRMDSISTDENNCPAIFEYERKSHQSRFIYLDLRLDYKADF